MPPKLALIFCIVFVLFLFLKARETHPMTSSSLWIVLLWFAIISSRPVSFWFGGGLLAESPEAYLEGSPIDRMVSSIMIAIGLVVLMRRRINWGSVLHGNIWVFIFFFYCFVSIIWTDYPYVSFKRWIKDAGNLIMVLILLTEDAPPAAFTAVFRRLTYLIIPFSVVFVRYLPDIGRYYNRWTYQPVYCGVTSEKNALGQIVFLCGIFLIWDFFETRSKGKAKDGVGLITTVLLLIMMLYLIAIAQSSTAMVCLIVGASLVVLLQSEFGIRQIAHLGAWSTLFGIILLILFFIPDLLGTFVSTLGRDLTFTGRTDLWAKLLEEPLNPLIGTGFQSFWIGARWEFYWEKYYFHANQAHNAFLETYLNLGLIGLILLILMIVSAARSLKNGVLSGNSLGVLCFSYFVVILFASWTEASFGRPTLIWIVMIFTLLSFSRFPVSIQCQQETILYSAS